MGGNTGDGLVCPSSMVPSIWAIFISSLFLSALKDPREPRELFTEPEARRVRDAPASEGTLAPEASASDGAGCSGCSSVAGDAAAAGGGCGL